MRFRSRLRAFRQFRLGPAILPELPTRPRRRRLRCPSASPGTRAANRSTWKRSSATCSSGRPLPPLPMGHGLPKAPPLQRFACRRWSARDRSFSGPRAAIPPQRFVCRRGAESLTGGRSYSPTCGSLRRANPERSSFSRASFCPKRLRSSCLDRVRVESPRRPHIHRRPGRNRLHRRPGWRRQGRWVRPFGWRRQVRHAP